MLVFFTALLLAFSFTTMAFAASDDMDDDDSSMEDDSEDEDEDEEDDDNVIDNGADAMEAIEDARDEIAKAEAALKRVTNRELALSKKTLAEAKDMLEKAEAAAAADDYGTAENKAEAAEDLAHLARTKYIGKAVVAIKDHCDDDSDESDEDEEDDDDSNEDDSDEDDSDDDKKKCPVVKQAIKCKVDMLRDGERDRKFCRDGEWKEKKEARMSDIVDGFIDSKDLTEEESAAIRKEVETLIRQLIALIMKSKGL